MSELVLKPDVESIVKVTFFSPWPGAADKAAAQVRELYEDRKQVLDLVDEIIAALSEAHISHQRKRGLRDRLHRARQNWLLKYGA